MMDHRFVLLFITFLFSLSCSFASSPNDPWQVSDGNTVCITAYFRAHANLTYVAVRPTKETYDRTTVLNVSDSATVLPLRSFCNGGTTVPTQAILINWGQSQYNLSMQFVGNSNGSYTVQEISLEYDVSDQEQFPYSDMSGKTIHTVSSSMNLLNIPLANSYQCLSGLTIPLETENGSLAGSIEFTDLRVEAFRSGANNSWFDPVEICAGDTTTTTETTTTETTTSTTTTTTTTTESTTSVAPGPESKWSVKDDNGDLCILSAFTGRFYIEYNATNVHTNQTFDQRAMLDIPSTGVDVDTSRSFCDTHTTEPLQQITLYWFNGTYRFNLTLQFKHDDNNTQNTDIKWVALEYDLNNAAVFPEATPTKYNLRTATSSREVGTISNGMYLKCDSGVPVTLVDGVDQNTVEAVMYGVKLEAFRTSKTATFDDHPQVCPGDAGNVTTPSPPHTTTPWPIGMPKYQVNFPVNGTACLLATFDMNIETWFYNISNQVANRTDVKLNNATVNQELSHCDYNYSILAIEGFYPGWILEMNFTRRSDKFALDELILSFNLTSFDKANNTLPQRIVTRVDDWSTQLGGAYKCAVATKWSLNTTNATTAVHKIEISLDEVHVQAFVVNGTFGDDIMCSSGGGDTSEIVPIAVGCALAALVIIVLIAYVIGRRRNRARGYESM